MEALVAAESTTSTPSWTTRSPMTRPSLWTQRAPSTRRTFTASWTLHSSTPATRRGARFLSLLILLCSAFVFEDTGTNPRGHWYKSSRTLVQILEDTSFNGIIDNWFDADNLDFNFYGEIAADNLNLDFNRNPSLQREKQQFVDKGRIPRWPSSTSARSSRMSRSLKSRLLFWSTC